jgi:sirohydrochlorin ferrochelatase
MATACPDNDSSRTAVALPPRSPETIARDGVAGGRSVAERGGVLLVGHGAPALDTPPELVRRFKALEAKRRSTGTPPSAEEVEADRALRRWPRTPANDPYREGLLRLADRLRPLLGGAPLVLAFNEFCAPSVAEAFADLVAAGVGRVTVVPSMLTPGGVHSEVEIPEELEALGKRYPHVTIVYAWPFDLDAIARLLAEQVAAAEARASGERASARPFEG